MTLTNSGEQELDQVAIQLHGDFSAVNRCGTSLAGHSTCAIVVSFVPTQVGAESGTLTVSDILRNTAQPDGYAGGDGPASAASFASAGIGRFRNLYRGPDEHRANGDPDQ